MASVFDCFLFNGELDVLEHRLRTLDGVVTTFVIIEAPTTFQGHTKPLYFSDAQARFSNWMNKVRHVVVPLPEAGSPWDREREQHAAFEASLPDVQDEDLVLVGDCDEVPFRHVLAELAETPRPPARLHMRNAVYWANTVLPTGAWTDGTMAFRWADRDDPALGVLLGREGSVWGAFADPVAIGDAGWHYGDLGDVDWISKKLGSFSHTELLMPSYSATQHMQRCRYLGVDYRSGSVLEMLSPAAIPPDVQRIEDIRSTAIRRDRFPAAPIRHLYGLFTEARRRLPPGVLVWADDHIVAFLAIFALPLLVIKTILRLLPHTARA